jgi:hypothetical protein
MGKIIEAIRRHGACHPKLVEKPVPKVAGAGEEEKAPVPFPSSLLNLPPTAGPKNQFILFLL